MFYKFLLLSVVMVSCSCSASNVETENFNTFDDEVERICALKFVPRKSCIPDAKNLQSVDDNYKTFKNSVVLIMSLDLTTVTALTIDETKRLDVRRVKSSSNEFGVPEQYWPLAEVEGNVYDYLNVSDGRVHRLGLIKGMGAKIVGYQSQGVWDSLKKWLESLD
ncbi:MAG: hypothetical protein K2X53_03605 [Alphaproteobacteria bacterium]|nr:hypothetical protein [Alphaproteobacteria bacterium]